MPLKKDIKEPSSSAKKENKKETPREAKPESTVETPWELKSDGTKVRKGRRLPYEKEIEQFFIELSGAISLADSFSAKAVELKAPELAYGYARLAKDDPRVKMFFERLLTGTAYTAALLPTVSLGVMIGFHFGFVHPKLGVPITMANGLMPLTRSEEMEMRETAQREQEAAANGTPSHPHGEAPKGDGGDSD